MAVLTQLLAKLRKWNRTGQQEMLRERSREEHLSRALAKVESYVVLLQSVLIWEQPTVSALSILAFNGLFWLVVSLELRLYFLLFSTMLVGMVYELWVERVWPEIRVPLQAEQVDNEDWTPLHPRVLSAPELSHYLNQVVQFAHDHYVWLLNTRRDQPGLFCCVMSVVCLLVMWLGWSVSGTTLLYLTFMSLLLAPGVCIHILPPTAHDKLRAWQERLRNPIHKDTDDEVEEFLPEQTGENLVLLQQAVEPDHSDHEDDDEFNMSSADLHQAVDVTDYGAPSGSFISGLLTMPAPEDLSLDSTDLSLELPQQPAIVGSPTEVSSRLLRDRKNKKQRVSALDIDETKTDSDSSCSSDGIHFQSLHFNGDSSSEEERCSSKKLNLRQRPSVTGQSRNTSTAGAVAGAAASVLSYSSAGAINLATLGAAMGQSLISSVISTTSTSATNTAPITTTAASSKSSREEEDDVTSDSDDFEMISEEEFANL